MHTLTTRKSRMKLPSPEFPHVCVENDSHELPVKWRRCVRTNYARARRFQCLPLLRCVHHARKILVFLHGLMTWKVMRRNVRSDIVIWRTRRLSNSTKYLLHASMTIISKKKIEICWRVVTCMLSNCSEMLIFGTFWKT